MANQEINKIFKYSVFSIPATILFILPSYTDPINLPKLLVLIPFAVTTMILFLFLRKYEAVGIRSKITTKVTALYLTLAASMLVSGFLGSSNYIRVLFGSFGRNNGLIYYISAIAICITLLMIFIRESEFTYLFRVISLTSLVFGSYSLIQLFELDPVSWSNPYNRVIGTLGNPNFSASILAIFSIFWFYSLYRLNNAKIIKRLLYFGIAIVLAFLSWATASIQGILVIGLGIALIGYIAIRERVSSPFVPYLFFLGGGSFLSVIFVSFLGIGPLGSILEQYTLKLRAWYAFFGLRAMIDSPWTGFGVDNYVRAFRVFRNEAFVSQYGWGLTSNNAHSTPFQIGASFGIPVFLLYCLIHLLVLYRALKIINSRESSILNSYLKGISIIWLLVFSQSLLSIEIIGLGIMNWILGALILSSAKYQEINAKVEMGTKERKAKARVLPVWTGPLTISSLLMGVAPAIPVSREDSAFQKISFTQIIDEKSKAIVEENLGKLSYLTLYYPNKVDGILINLYKADKIQEIESIIDNIYRVDPDDAYVADLKATFFQNTNQVVEEVKVREKIRRLDPWNVKLELALAQAYKKIGDAKRLQESVDKMYKLDPDSAEYQQGLSLIENQSITP
jgi:tetratricopeptide (TPR) repeat protein